MRYEQEDKLAQGNELVIYRGGRCGGLLLHPVSHIQKEHTQRYILHFTIPQLSSVGSRVVALWLACAVIAFLEEVREDNLDNQQRYILSPASVRKRAKHGLRAGAVVAW